MQKHLLLSLETGSSFALKIENYEREKEKTLPLALRQKVAKILDSWLLWPFTFLKRQFPASSTFVAKPELIAGKIPPCILVTMTTDESKESL